MESSRQLEGLALSGRKSHSGVEEGTPPEADMFCHLYTVYTMKLARRAGSTSARRALNERSTSWLDERS